MGWWIQESLKRERKIKFEKKCSNYFPYIVIKYTPVEKTLILTSPVKPKRKEDEWKWNEGVGREWKKRDRC